MYPINKVYSVTWKIVNIKLKRNPTQWQDKNVLHTIVRLHIWPKSFAPPMQAWNRLARVCMKKLPTKGWHGIQYLIATTVLHCAKVDEQVPWYLIQEQLNLKQISWAHKNLSILTEWRSRRCNQTKTLHHSQSPCTQFMRCP